MNDYSCIPLILILPLAVFVLLGVVGKKIPVSVSGLLGTASMLACAAFAYFAAYTYFFKTGMTGGAYQPVIVLKHTWLQFSSTLSIDMGIILDPISVMMLVVVTTVSLMVHIYSLGYMKGDERFSTYYAFLSLFSFSMLGLVVSTNIFQMYMFWELVGVSSFLLVGYYYEKPSAVAAAKKAFIVTRFADFGFLAGILILSYYSQSLDFQTIIERMATSDSPFYASAAGAGFLGASMLTWALILIFMGGAGKSAMFPLHIWLPDAMEGPTPVSALIHAATMVVAGVFLVARLFHIYAIVPAALDVVAYTGAFSALFAAIIACTQTDIKRVLAYSTMSQIGYMMFALGVAGAYWGTGGLGFTASMFHLFTHAMFKALLFLGAGAVIHYVHSNEMNDMGGLRKKMPVTHIVFLIACLAISGVPPFSGFFSKEEILTAAFEHNRIIYYVGIITAGLTAFYMFRLYYMIFWNKPYYLQRDHHEHKHEAPFSMILPLLFLGLATMVAGFVPFRDLVTTTGVPLEETETHMNLVIIAVSAGLIGIIISTIFYARDNKLPEEMAEKMGGIYRAAYRKFYIDELYIFITKRVLFNLIARPAAWIDRNIVDGMMNFTAVLTSVVSDQMKGLQSGKMHKYVIWFFVGSVLMMLLLIFKIK